LIVEEEPAVRAALRTVLGGNGFAVTEAATGAEATAVNDAGQVDVVLLDLVLPDTDGVTLLARLRKARNVPIVVLSGRRPLADRVRALDAGADDYVMKPFHAAELLARIRAVMRRTKAPPEGPRLVVVGDVEIDQTKRVVRRRGEMVRLTPTELRLLLELVGNPGMLLTHAELLKRVWGETYGTESHYLRVYIAQLRRKLGDSATRSRMIRTEPGLGYRWMEKPG
jgi:two-component system KDP operon response regulator KdpE